MSTLWQLRLEVGDEAAGLAAETWLEDEALAVARFRAAPDAPAWRVEALFAACPDAEAWTARLGQACTIARLPEADWVMEAQKFLPAVTAGRFHVHGSHLPRHRSPGAHDILIDAGPAFGTGQHESTRGCLLALDRLSRDRPVRRALDLGCGTGVLAIAIAMAWRAAVCGTDIEPVAARLAKRNARRNRVGAWIRTAAGPGLRPALARSGGPYDLVVGNILARPLIRLAPAIAGALAPSGTVVLSGLLTWQAPAVLAAYRLQGLALDFRVRLGGWDTLVLRRGPGRW